MMEHTCSYYCERPDCIRAQRDELRERLESAEAELAEKADPKLAERCNLASRDADLPVAHQCLFHEAAVALGGGK